MNVKLGLNQLHRKEKIFNEDFDKYNNETHPF